MHNRVLLMHVKCGMMMDGKRLFDEMPVRNVVSWNIIIGGLVDCGDYEVAFDLFLILWRECGDAGTRMFNTMIKACAGLGRGNVGRQLHSNALKMGINEDVFVSCGLINMYGKCGIVEDAQLAFDEMPEKTLVGWNTLISGYVHNGYIEKALNLHSLVDFYGKWGKIKDARHVFDSMPCKNLASWNAMIMDIVTTVKGLRLFWCLSKWFEGMAPDHVTFLTVLSACAHSGLSDRGWEIFESMSREYKVKPRKQCIMPVWLSYWAEKGS
ncbi:hypothetical protein IFM89_008716 [Coptis chinensis]|uniref:Pentatricopeptide repeat-containing protein n=1 Tax=Coptis chinensis TaxID=261450 RepID=A0A835GVU1_9MAGN|nr:hypothetical protein IFM89_008716 [Coptis chinensis]